MCPRKERAKWEPIIFLGLALKYMLCYFATCSLLSSYKDLEEFQCCVVRRACRIDRIISGEYVHPLAIIITPLPHEKYSSPPPGPSTLSPDGVRSKSRILSYESGVGEGEAPWVQFLVYCSLSTILVYLKAL